jgi:hypothetical protein
LGGERGLFKIQQGSMARITWLNKARGNWKMKIKNKKSKEATEGQ